MMGFSASLVEAWRNIVTGTSRALLITVLLALGAGGLAAWDAAVQAEILRQAAAYEASGASTLILETEHAVDGGACDRLRSVVGVDGAAALTMGETMATLDKLPGQKVPRVRASAGMAAILGLTANGDGGVWLPQDLADSVGASPGGFIGLNHQQVLVAGIYPHPDDGRRTGLGFAVIEPVPASGIFDECWVKAWPDTEVLEPLMLASKDVSAAGVGSPDVITQWNTRLGRSFGGGRSALKDARRGTGG